jgi:hypothetical protein
MLYGKKIAKKYIARVNKKMLAQIVIDISHENKTRPMANNEREIRLHFIFVCIARLIVNETLTVIKMQFKPG